MDGDGEARAIMCGTCEESVARSSMWKCRCRAGGPGARRPRDVWALVSGSVTSVFASVRGRLKFAEAVAVEKARFGADKGW